LKHKPEEGKKMKKFALWAINFVLAQGLVSRQDVKTLLKQRKKDVEEHPIRIETGYLRQVIDIDINYTVDATDGTETITDDTEGVFDWIDKDFENWGLNKPSKPTARTEFVFCQLVKNGPFSYIYGNLKTNAPPVPLDNACVTQSQIFSWVKKNKEEIIKDRRNRFFLLKKDAGILCKDDPTNKNLFVACVDVRSIGGLNVNVLPFSHDNEWNVECGPLFVFPQLTV
jgi:hypothetical protein